MHRKLTSEQIRDVCVELASNSAQPTVRAVMGELRARYGASGRTARVAEILRGVGKPAPSPVHVTESSDVASLRYELLRAEQRASRAEEIERRHQDFWAARYQEKVQELEERVVQPQTAGVSSEQYLRVYRRLAELAERLALYEAVGPLLPPR